MAGDLFQVRSIGSVSAEEGCLYQNQSHWTSEPMVHIVPHWNFEGLEGQEILVAVYTNCDELELS